MFSENPGRSGYGNSCEVGYNAAEHLPAVRMEDELPVDLKTRKSTSYSCQIEIHFSIQIIKFLMKYYLLCFRISGRLIIFFIKDSY